MRRLILSLGVLLPFIVSSQIQQIKLFGKYKGLVSDKENTQGFLYQSVDGAKSCEGKISWKYSGSTISAITIDLGTCGVLLGNFGKTFVFNSLEKTDDIDNVYYFLENTDATARIRFESDVYYLENLIPKVQTGKVRYRFYYNDRKVETTNPIISRSSDIDNSNQTGGTSQAQDVKNIETTETVVVDDSKNNNQSNEDKGAVANSTSVQSSDGYFLYTLVKGDYIYKLARDYNCSPSDLLKINGISADKILYPGDQIKVCGVGSSYETPEYVTSKSNSFNEAKSLKTYGTEMKQEYENLVGTYNKLRKSFKSLENEKISLQTYSEEMKMEYELLVSEYDKVRASYNSLMKEYKELVADYKKVKKENEELKKLVKQLQGGKSSDLSTEEKEKVEALQDKLSTFKDQLKDMREKLEESKEESEDLEFEMEDTKDNAEDKEKEGSPAGSNFDDQENKPLVSIKTDNSESTIDKGVEVNENNEETTNNSDLLVDFCKDYEALLVSDKDVEGKVLFSKSMSMNVGTDGKITELTFDETDVIKKENQVKKAEELLTSKIIQKFENLKWNGSGEKSAKLIVDFTKSIYQIKIKKNNLTFEDELGQNLKSNHPHVKLILAKYSERGRESGKYEVHVIESDYQLHEMSIDGSSILGSLGNQKGFYVSKFSGK